MYKKETDHDLKTKKQKGMQECTPVVTFSKVFNDICIFVSDGSSEDIILYSSKAAKKTMILLSCFFSFAFAFAFPFFLSFDFSLSVKPISE